jgi:hypothetical protein
MYWYFATADSLQSFSLGYNKIVTDDDYCIEDGWPLIKTFKMMSW